MPSVGPDHMNLEFHPLGDRLFGKSNLPNPKLAGPAQGSRFTRPVVEIPGQKQPFRPRSPFPENPAACSAVKPQRFMTSGKFLQVPILRASLVKPGHSCPDLFGVWLQPRIDFHEPRQLWFLAHSGRLAKSRPMHPANPRHLLYFLEYFSNPNHLDAQPPKLQISPSAFPRTSDWIFWWSAWHSSGGPKRGQPAERPPESHDPSRRHCRHGDSRGFL